MRTYDIYDITPGVTTSPSLIRLADTFGDLTASFHGKEWIDEAGTRYPFYDPQPLGTTLLVATTFEIIGNAKYNGKYTVYTTPTSGGLTSSEFTGGYTNIRVNEIMPAGVGAELTTGQVTNISTYSLNIQGGSPLLILENQRNDVGSTHELVGRFSNAWGEAFQQNLLNQLQSFAGPMPPANALPGQLWFDIGNQVLKVMSMTDWVPLNGFDDGRPAYHLQPIADTTWTIQHNLDAAGPPFIVDASFYVETAPSVYQQILPASITYVDKDTISVSFTIAYSGHASIRKIK